MDERDEGVRGGPGDDDSQGGRDDRQDQNLSQTVLQQAARIERLEAHILGMQESTESRLAGLRRLLRTLDGEAGAQWRRQAFLLSEVSGHLKRGETSLATSKVALACELAQDMVRTLSHEKAAEPLSSQRETH